MKNHLQSSIPELFLQVHNNKLLKLTTFVKEIFSSTLLRRSECAGISLDKRVPTEFHEMYPLSLVAWRFQVDDCTIEKGYECIDEFFDDDVQSGIFDWVNVVDVARYPTRNNIRQYHI